MFCLFDVSSKPVKIKKNIEENVFNIFKLPIHYDGRKKKINPSIIHDLEMNNVIYPSLCNFPDSQICKSFIHQTYEYYTNNIPFLNHLIFFLIEEIFSKTLCDKKKFRTFAIPKREV